MRTKLLISVLSILSLLVLGCGNSVEDFVITNQQVVAQNTGNLAVNFSRTNVTAQTTQQNFANADQYVVTLLDGNGNVVAEQEVNADLTNDTQTVTFNDVPEGDYTVVISSFLNGVLTDQVSRVAVSVQDEVTTTIGTGTTETFSDFTGTLEVEAPVLAQSNAFYRLAHLSPFAGNVDILVNGTQVGTDVPYVTITNYIPITAGSVRIQVRPNGEATDVVDETVTLIGGQFVTAAVTGVGVDTRVVAQTTGFNLDFFTDDVSPTAGEVRVRFVNATTRFDGLSLDAQADGEIEITGDADSRSASDYALVAVSDLNSAFRLEAEDGDGDDLFVTFVIDMEEQILGQTVSGLPRLEYSDFINTLSGLENGSGGNVSIFIADSVRGQVPFILTVDTATGGAAAGALVGFDNRI